MSTVVVMTEIDKIIADISQREQPAKAYAQKQSKQPGVQQSYIDILYGPAGLFNTDLLPLDTPITAAVHTLTECKQAGYAISIVTIRPHWMETATRTWLADHAVPFDTLQCKNYTTDRYTRNTIWKTTACRQAVEQYDQVLYVDHDTRNLDAAQHINQATLTTSTHLDIQLLVQSAAPASTQTFYYRQARKDYELIDTRTQRIRLRLSDESSAQHFTDLWNFVVGPPVHCGSCRKEIAKGEHTFGHSHYYALCFYCSCANE